MRVLHIVNWYPNIRNENEAIWIKRHINSLNDFVQKNDVLHFEIKESRSFSIINRKNHRLKQFIVMSPFMPWFLIEWIHFFWLFYQFKVKRIQRNYDVVNFHIAYPMLTYWHLIKSIKKPHAIIEHWSAYHLNFGMKKSPIRIQNIFKQNIPLIAVSQALANDIKKFASSEFPVFVLPNIVDKNVFFTKTSGDRDKFFFMLSSWKLPKDPLLAIKAFQSFRKDHKEYKLIIGGEGPLFADIKNYINKEQLNDSVELKGVLNSEEAASYMQKCHAYLHPSKYETFSVVCAEAICCGAPVIASNVGALKELVNGRGILVENNSESWEKAMRDILEYTINNSNIPDFSKESLGKQYFSILNEIVDAPL